MSRVDGAEPEEEDNSLDCSVARDCRALGDADEGERSDVSSDDTAGELDQAHAPARIDGDRGFITTATGPEAYFHAQARKLKTSDRRAQDYIETFTLEEYTSALSRANGLLGSYAAQAAQSRTVQLTYDVCHPAWLLELHQGFDLLFRGLGSKRKLLNRFASKVLAKHGQVIICNAFMSTYSITDTLASLESAATSESRLDGAAAIQPPSDAGDKHEERAHSICYALRRRAAGDNIFLVIHSVDALQCQSARAQSVLAILAASPRIALVASVEHLRATLLFPASLERPREDIQGARGFCWSHHHTPTYSPYLAEVASSLEPAKIFPSSIYPSAAAGAASQGGPRGRIRGAAHILASVTEKAKRAFAMLGQLQLRRGEAMQPHARSKLTSIMVTSDQTITPGSAIRLSLLYSRTQDELIVSNQNHLEGLMHEFRDHDLVKTSSNAPEDDMDIETDDTDETRQQWIWICLGHDELFKVLEDHT
ncbi:uncharacterized protein L969DRAFT_90529 [Mixia osmundae IAM 14324]|uniref:Origin recognition complex subunit 2 n=1 Tax=Mixia osmundae (strain CBS 9802 / IAM 14324 / JCM 22182 / KY 12970) TaxID=764103 RepID=G7E2P4_MIXOS|nr:uncharacterized protein L969DRAFT_90529 [Mixia osmundae IAM 14324]KEI36969.1 hypothetical protein L969DRAFT_90529 [Mixia osmundae IAM 14324]GAA97104.1 hypothetical protein E5Q_03779 [Mixia osmundae IAM 14324]